jgi:hypothetical protein
LSAKAFSTCFCLRVGFVVDRKEISFTTQKIISRRNLVAGLEF